MVSQILLNKLLELRLLAFYQGLREQAANPQYTQLPFEERLLLLIDLECTHRSESRLKRRIKLADFPLAAAIEEIDFSPQRQLDRRFLLDLAQCQWIEKALNLIILGATGTGKSFLACAFGLAACRSGFSVRYFRAARLLHSLTAAKKDGSFFSLLRSLAKIDLLIIDDWMRDPIPLSAAQDLLKLFDDRFGKSATLFTAQVPVSDWHLRFPDPTLADAILDRSVHNAHRIEIAGESQRKLRGFRAMSHT